MIGERRAAALAILGGNPDGGTAFSVAVLADGQTTVQSATTTARVDLAELTRLALSERGLSPADVHEVRVDRGPGSYIGLRVAVTFARCFAAFSGCRLLAADSLAAAACAALRADGGLVGRRICVLLDGRQGRAQFAAFRIGKDGSITPESEPALLADDAAQGSWGDGDATFADASLRARWAKERATAAPAAIPRVDAATLFDPRLPVRDASLLDLEPLYLAGSYVG